MARVNISMLNQRHRVAIKSYSLFASNILFNFFIIISLHLSLYMYVCNFTCSLIVFAHILAHVVERGEVICLSI